MLTRLILTLAILALVLLDVAALDDITTGNQPHFYWEWTMLGVSVPVLAACGWGWSRLKAGVPTGQ